MRKPKTVTVARGWLCATGTTKAEAKANLEKQIDWACNAATLHVEKRFDRILIVAASPTGWTVEIVEPDTMANGSTHFSSCQYGLEPFDDVVASARNWAAQNAWTQDVDNDEWFIEQAGLKDSAKSSRGDLRGWIKWQRSYNSMIAEGKTPAVAHLLASGY
jgi:hypothetical protein